MSRLSNQQFLDRHYFLFALWHEGLQEVFAVLPTHMQSEVHRVYCPSWPLTDQQRIDHRQRVTKATPSLPQRAGRGFARIRRAYADASEAGESTSDNPVAFRMALRPQLHISTYRTTRHRIRVIGIARPDPNLKRLAPALVVQAREEFLDQHGKRTAA